MILILMQFNAISKELMEIRQERFFQLAFSIAKLERMDFSNCRLCKGTLGKNSGLACPTCLKLALKRARQYFENAIDQIGDCIEIGKPIAEARLYKAIESEVVNLKEVVLDILIEEGYVCLCPACKGYKECGSLCKRCEYWATKVILYRSMKLTEEFIDYLRAKRQEHEQEFVEQSKRVSVKGRDLLLRIVAYSSLSGIALYLLWSNALWNNPKFGLIINLFGDFLDGLHRTAFTLGIIVCGFQCFSKSEQMNKRGWMHLAGICFVLLSIRLILTYLKTISVQ